MKRFYDYENQHWVKNGKPVHHALCGQRKIPCNACESITKAKKRKEIISLYK